MHNNVTLLTEQERCDQQIESIDRDCNIRRTVSRFGRKLRCADWYLMAIGNASFYGDESGAHGQGPFVLSGYVANDDVWEDFENKWEAVLRCTPTIEYFHMRECFKLEGQFAGWSRRDADKKMHALIDVLRPFLKAKTVTEFTSIVEWSMFNNVVVGPFREVYHRPYFFALEAIMAELARWFRQRSIEEPVWFFMDDQIPLVEMDAAKQFYYAKATVDDYFVKYYEGLNFRDDKLCYELQAADLLAWQRHRRELNLAEDQRKPRPEFERLIKLGTGKLMRYREDGLKRTVDRTNR